VHLTSGAERVKAGIADEKASTARFTVGNVLLSVGLYSDLIPGRHLRLISSRHQRPYLPFSFLILRVTLSYLMSHGR